MFSADWCNPRWNHTKTFICNSIRWSHALWNHISSSEASLLAGPHQPFPYTISKKTTQELKTPWSLVDIDRLPFISGLHQQSKVAVTIYEFPEFSCWINITSCSSTTTFLPAAHVTAVSRVDGVTFSLFSLLWLDFAVRSLRCWKCWAFFDFLSNWVLKKNRNLSDKAAGFYEILQDTAGFPCFLQSTAGHYGIYMYMSGILGMRVVWATAWYCKVCTACLTGIHTFGVASSLRFSCPLPVQGETCDSVSGGLFDCLSVDSVIWSALYDVHMRAHECSKVQNAAKHLVLICLLFAKLDGLHRFVQKTNMKECLDETLRRKRIGTG